MSTRAPAAGSFPPFYPLPGALSPKADAMPYCLSCGKLRDTIGGRCEQCRKDELAKIGPERAARRTRDAYLLELFGTTRPLGRPR